MGVKRCVATKLLAVVCMLLVALGVALGVSLGTALVAPQQARAEGERYCILVDCEIKKGGNSESTERYFYANSPSFDFSYDDIAYVLTDGHWGMQDVLDQLDVNSMVGAHPANGDNETLLNNAEVTSGSDTWKVSLSATAFDSLFRVYAVANESEGTAEITSKPDSDDGCFKPSTVGIEATPKSGYRFKGWKLKCNFGENETRPILDNSESAVTKLVLRSADEYNTIERSTLTVTAEFEAIEYSIAVSADPADGSRGTASATVGGAAAKTATIGQEVQVVDKPKTGYELASLTYTPEGSTNPVDITSKKSFTMPANNVSVKATFKPITYIVSFDKNAEDATGTMKDMEFGYNQTKALTANAFERPGYKFDGWNTSADGTGDTIDDKSPITPKANMRLFAQWTAISPTQYVINVIEPEHGVVNASADKAVAGEAVDLTAKPDDGYYFVAWKVTDANGNPIKVTSNLSAQAEVGTEATGDTGGQGDATTNADAATNAADGQGAATTNAAATADAGSAETKGTFVMPASNVNVTATFEREPEPVVTHTITFNKNADDATGEMSPQTVNDNVATKLAENAFARTGYTFVGWNTSADGKGETLANQAEVTTTADMTLYAQWSKNEHSIKAPTVDTSAGSNIVAHDAAITYTITQSIPDDATRVRIWFDLHDTMEYTTGADDIVVRTADGADVPATKTIDGQHLEVIVEDATSIVGQSIRVSFSAKLRSDANLTPYLSSNRSFAQIPYQAHTEFWFADGTNATTQSTVEKLKIGNNKGGGSGSSTTTRSSAAAAASRGTSTLAKTSDPTSVSAAVAAAFAGAVAIAAGRARRRR